MFLSQLLSLFPVIAASFGTTFLLGFAARRWAPKFGLVDRPTGRKNHAQPTPLGGGLAVLGGLLAAAAASSLMGQADLWPWCLFAAGFTALGLCDDRFGVDYKIRLAVEFLLASSAVACGWRTDLAPANMPWLIWLERAACVTLIVTLVNALNMLDNMDALSASVACASAIILTLPSLESGDLTVAVPGYALVAALLGFLRHNRPPAKLFLGDSGSYLLGFWLSACWFHHVGSSPAIVPSLPWLNALAWLLPLSLPLYDLTTVVFLRLRSGRSPFSADRRHVSHRLVDRGYTRPQAVQFLFLLQFLVGIPAILPAAVYYIPAAVALPLSLLVLFLFFLWDFFLQPVPAPP